MRNAMFAISTMFLLFFAEGCAVSNAQQSHEPCQEQLYETLWQLTTIDNDTIELKHPATIRFEKGGRISGFGGCNNYFGKSELTSTSISFGPIGSTRKYCMGAPGEVERRFFAVLQGTKWWNFDDEGHLQIFDDEHRLIFSKAQ